MIRASLLLLALLVSRPALSALSREVEPNDESQTAQPLLPPASVGGTIGSAGDRDVFAIALEAGQTVTADLLARGFRAEQHPGSQLSARIELLDTGGTTVLAQDESQGDFDDPTVAYTAVIGGKYLVRVQDQSPTEGGPGYSYVLSLEVGPDESAATAIPLTPPILPTIDALIHPPGDLDHYRVPVQAGQILTVDIDSAVFNPSQPPAKTVVTIYDPLLNVVGEDAYTAADPQDPFVQVAAVSSGAYTIRVKELRSFVGTTNTYYQMSIDLGPASSNGSFATASPIALPRAVSGVVSPTSEQDHFRFLLFDAATLRADVDAREGLLSLLEGGLALHDSTGILTQDSSSPDPVIVAPIAAGSYSLAIEGDCTGGCSGADAFYTLYLDADGDGDGLVLPADNCPMIDNASQTDSDRDGIGEPCDNCASVFNPGQADSDGDGHGDACPPCTLPPEVATDLVFSGSQVLTWTPSSAIAWYNVYRGSVTGGDWAYSHSCLVGRLTESQASDASVPAADRLFYYLVSGTNSCGEGTLGLDRPNDNGPC